MSKEEIEAIEYLKSKLKDTLPLYEDIEVDGKVFRMNVLQLETKWNNETAIKVETVLDLLNKQQNEIERLKEQLNQYYDGKLFTANQIKAIEKERNKNFIPKEAIRKKIKELEKRIEEENSMLELNQVCKENYEPRVKYLNYAINIYKKLLGDE